MATTQTFSKGIKMKGLPARFAKMGFKKGWKAYRSRMHGDPGRKGKRGKIHHAVMLDGDFSAPALIQRPVRTIKSITPEKIFSPLIDLGLLIVGMAAGSLVKRVSPIKNPHIMNSAHAVVGIGGSLLTKNRFVKMPLLGIALQSAISEAKILIPNLVPLAGDDEVIYLPVNTPVPQIVHGDDSRVGAVVDGESEEIAAEYETVDGDDSRVGSVVDGDEGEMSGEGENA